MLVHSIPTILTVAICFITGVYYLLLHLSLPVDRTNLTFSCLCFAVAFYNGTCVGLYNATSVADGIFWQTGNLVGTGFVAVCFICFVMDLTRQRNRKVLYGGVVFFSVCILVILSHSGELTLSAERPAMKRVVLGNLLDIVYYEVELGPIPQILVSGTVVCVIYAMWLLLAYQRRERDPFFWRTIIAICCFFAAIINDAFVAIEVYQFIYLAEYAFLIVVFTMTYLLLRRFVRIYRREETLKTSLQETNLALQKTYQQLEHESELLSATMQSIGDGVVVADSEGQIVLANLAAREITGHQQIIGLSIDQVLMLRNDGGTLIQQLFGSLEEPRTSFQKTVADLTLQRRDHSEVIVSLCVTPVELGQDNALGAVFALRDVTVQKGIEKEIIMADKMESLAVLANSIAHDCKNFLSSIQGVLSVIDKKLPHDPEGAKELVETGDDAIASATEMVRRLMDFTGVRTITTRSVDVESVVSRAAKMALEDSNVNLRIDNHAAGSRAELDEAHITQALHNIVLNARQSMPAGGLVTISIRNVIFGEENQSFVPAGRYVQISIEDEGVGVAREHLKKIFQPYFTTKSEGTGLGLASAYSIVKQHGGSIKVQSEIRKGTSFDLYLPPDVPNCSEDAP